MSPLDGARAVLATGGLVLWLGLTDAMLKYLRPGMRPFLVAAGLVLVVAGARMLVLVRRTARTGATSPPAVSAEGADHVHHHGASRVGWLLVVPVAVFILFGPQPLGEYAISRTPNLPPYAFDIAAYASRTGQRVPELRFVDVIAGVEQTGNREYLTTHDVELVGFVSDRGGAKGFVLTRYLMSCCAADGQPLSVRIVAPSGAAPDVGSWVRATVRMTGAMDPELPRSPQAALVALEAVEEPASPYESLR